MATKRAKKNRAKAKAVAAKGPAPKVEAPTRRLTRHERNALAHHARMEGANAADSENA